MVPVALNPAGRPRLPVPPCACLPVCRSGSPVSRSAVPIELPPWSCFHPQPKRIPHPARPVHFRPVGVAIDSSQIVQFGPQADRFRRQVPDKGLVRVRSRFGMLVDHARILKGEGSPLRRVSLNVGTDLPRPIRTAYSTSAAILCRTGSAGLEIGSEWTGVLHRSTVEMSPEIVGTKACFFEGSSGQTFSPLVPHWSKALSRFKIMSAKAL